MLIHNFFYYLAHQDELVKQYNGQYLIIVDKKVVYSSTNERDALNKGLEMAGLGNFIMQLCTPGEEAYTTSCYTPWVQFTDALSQSKPEIAH
jgi:hypothetical protein